MMDNETQWCMDNYNSTDCTMIRDDAQATTMDSLHLFYIFTAIWCMSQVFIVSVWTVVRNWHWAYCDFHSHIC
jgi:hypothetical protein